jgi:hypothetical protein
MAGWVVLSAGQPAHLSQRGTAKMQIYIALAFAVLGLFIYFAVKTNAELKEVGRITYFAGLLAFLLQIGSASLSFLSK